MFYSDSRDSNLRLGDVISSIHFPKLIIDEFAAGSGKSSFNIEFQYPVYSVVLTPCCSIENKYITITPLLPLYAKILELNQRVIEDFTRLNQIIAPIEVVADATFSKMNSGKQLEISSSGKKFTKLNEFYYYPAEILPKYDLSFKQNMQIIGNYYIDFKNVITIESKELARGSQKNFSDFKLLQLSIQARDDLRNKLAYYYSRQPAEDM